MPNTAEKKISQNHNEKIINQLIVFRAGNEEFGVPIDAVREIIKMTNITPVPNSPNFIKGIINVRGEIVTAIDMKIRFSLDSEDETEAKHIIVTKQQDGLFGLIVDEVIEVLRVQQKDIRPPPSVISHIHEKYVSGVISHDHRLIILLELSLVLSHEELLRIRMMHKIKNKDMISSYPLKNPESSKENPDQASISSAKIITSKHNKFQKEKNKNHHQK